MHNMCTHILPHLRVRIWKWVNLLSNTPRTRSSFSHIHNLVLFIVIPSLSCWCVCVVLCFLAHLSFLWRCLFWDREQASVRVCVCLRWKQGCRRSPWIVVSGRFVFMGQTHWALHTHKRRGWAWVWGSPEMPWLEFCSRRTIFNIPYHITNKKAHIISTASPLSLHPEHTNTIQKNKLKMCISTLLQNGYNIWAIYVFDVVCRVVYFYARDLTYLELRWNNYVWFYSSYIFKSVERLFYVFCGDSRSLTMRSWRCFYSSYISVFLS